MQLWNKKRTYNNENFSLSWSSFSNKTYLTLKVYFTIYSSSIILQLIRALCTIEYQKSYFRCCNSDSLIRYIYLIIILSITFTTLIVPISHLTLTLIAISVMNMEVDGVDEVGDCLIHYTDI